MPFDGTLVFQSSDQATRALWRRSNQLALFDRLEELKIIPVSLAVLDAHKENEIRKHPPNFLWRHREYQPLYALASIAVSLATAIICHTFELEVWEFVVCSIAPLLGVAYFMFGKIKHPAYWQEKLAYHYADIPLPIRQIVQRVTQTDSAIQVFVGTLYQESRVLDPYVIVVKFNEETASMDAACLGIWDGDKIIEIAKT